MFLTRAASLVYDAALAIVYPQSCAICGYSVESRRWGIACESCWDQTHTFGPNETLCLKCGALTPGTKSVAPEQLSCGRCDQEPFTAARACGVYEGALRATVLALKQEPHLPARLIELLVENQKRPPLDGATIITPVPLHYDRERERGFNQALVIARELARLSATPIIERLLVRTAHTNRHRTGMDGRARRETVANVFKVLQPALVSGERILLVDDVFTTGATVSACTIALRSANASQVLVLTIGRPLEAPILAC